MKVIDNTLYFTWDELIRYGFTFKFISKVTSESRSGKRSSYFSIQDPQDLRSNLISYDSIPESSRIKRNLPTKEELIRRATNDTLQTLPKPDPKAYEYYYNGPASDKAKELQQLAAWMMVCAPVNRTAARKMGYDSVDGFYEDVIRLLNDQNIWSGTSLQIFKKKKLKPFYQYYKTHPSHFDPKDPDYYFSSLTTHTAYEAALEQLVSKKYGTRNASRVNEEMLALLIRLYADPKKPNLTHVRLAFLREADKMVKLFQETNGAKGWDPRNIFQDADGNPKIITEQTIHNHLYDPEIKQVWWSKRHGKKHNETYSMILNRKPASFANAKWIMDGTPIHMYFMGQGKNGKMTAFNRLNVFFIMDEYSWAIIGYFISFSENADQVLYALRDACMRTGHMPHEIQSDNSSAIQSWQVQEAIRQISPRYIPAQAGNARAKRIEPWLHQFNNRILRYKTGYMGNPHASLDYKPNEDALIEQRKLALLPSLKEAIQILDDSLNEWNSHVFDGSKPLEKYHKSLEATRQDQIQFTRAHDIAAFWYTPGDMITIKDTSSRSRATQRVFQPTPFNYSNRGVIVSRKNPENNVVEKHRFCLMDPDFNASRIGDKFTLKIEPEKFQKAYIYQNGKPVLGADQKPIMLTQSTLHPSAQVDHTSETRTRLAAEQQAKKAQTAEVNERWERYMAIAEKNGHTATPLDTSHVWGKEISTPAAASLNERWLNEEENDDTEYIPVDDADHKVNTGLKRY